jgi:hypothetical protein
LWKLVWHLLPVENVEDTLCLGHLAATHVAEDDLRGDDLIEREFSLVARLQKLQSLGGMGRKT